MRTKYTIILIITGLMVGWFGSNVYATQIAERKFGPLLGVLTDYKISASAISAEVNISNLTSEEFTVDKIHTSGDGLDNLLIEIKGLRLGSKAAKELKEETGIDFSEYSLNAKSSTLCLKGICKGLASVNGEDSFNLSFNSTFDEKTLVKILDLINAANESYLSEAEVGLMLLDILAKSQTVELSIKFEDLGILSLIKSINPDIPSIISSKFEYSIKLNNDSNLFETSLLIDGDFLAKINLLLGVDILNTDFSSAEVAAQATKGISIKSFDLVLEDKGGLEKIPEFHKVKEEIILAFDEKNKDYKFRLIAQKSPVTQILLEATNSKSIEELSREISSFLSDPSKLEISFKPNKPFPVAALLPVVMGLSDGSLLLNYADDLNILFNSRKLVNNNIPGSEFDEIDKEERRLLEKINQLKLKKKKLEAAARNKKENNNATLSSCDKFKGIWYYDESVSSDLNFGKYVYKEDGHVSQFGMYTDGVILESNSNYSWKCDGEKYTEIFDKEENTYSIIKSKKNILILKSDDGSVYSDTRIPPKIDFLTIKDKDIRAKAQLLMKANSK